MPAPARGIGNVVTLSAANPVAPLVPRDDRRRAAVVIAVDNDIWISASEGTASDLAGTSGGGSAFYLPAGIGFPFDTRTQLWMACTTTEPSPTAEATRLTEPERTSPTANTPARLVWNAL